MSTPNPQDICLNNHGGNSESISAFHALTPHLNRQTAMVVAAIVADPEGVTAEEIEETLGLSRSSVSARCSELRKRGLILPKQVEVDPPGDSSSVYLRRKNRSGSWAAVLVWNENVSPWPWIKLLEKEMETAVA